MSKAQFVRLMFNDIAHKYDLLNDVLSLGTHRLWKKKLIHLALENKPQSALDCATGTGDIAFKLKHAGVSKVVGIDFSENMISKAIARSENNNISFQVEDIQKLPFKNHEFDVATISFGIRNVENLNLSIQELARVAKNIFILEFGQPQNKFFKFLYFSLLKLYVPFFGILSKRKDAYEYLISSSEKFPSGEQFINIMKTNTTYKHYGYVSVFGGIAYIYYAKTTNSI